MVQRVIAMSLEGAPKGVQVIDDGDDDAQHISKENRQNASGAGSRWEKLAGGSTDQASN